VQFFCCLSFDSKFALDNQFVIRELARIAVFIRNKVQVANI